MRLDEAKNVELSFSTWYEYSETIRLDIEQSRVKVVGNAGRNKLLIIYYGRQLCHTPGFNIFWMKRRCAVLFGPNTHVIFVVK